jgi:hypothetical protein
VEFLGGLNNSGSVVHSTTISAVITWILPSETVLSIPE